jgi:hypothetical protein
MLSKNPRGSAFIAEDIIQAQLDASKTLTILLIVRGIGIMNVMLVSVNRAHA